MRASALAIQALIRTAQDAVADAYDEYPNENENMDVVAELLERERQAWERQHWTEQPRV